MDYFFNDRGKGNKYSRRVDLALTHSGLSQAELAKKSGITQPSINHLLHNAKRPSSANNEIATACGVSSEWLATGKGSMLPENNIDPRTNNNLPTDAQALLKTYFELTDERKVELQDFSLIQKALQLEQFKPKVEN